MLIRKYILIISSLLIIHPSVSYAGDFHFNIGASLVYAKLEGDLFRERDDKQNMSSGLYYGIGYNFDNRIIINLNTNRGLEIEQHDSIVMNKQQEVTNLVTRLRVDSLQLGTIIDKYNPYISISNVEYNVSLYNNYFSHVEKKHSVLYGFGINMPLSKRVSIGLSYILPNSRLNLDSAIVTNINIKI